MDLAHAAMIAFPKEWVAVFLLLLCDFFWAILIHFKLKIALGDLALLGSALAIAIFFRRVFVQPRLALCAESFALSISATAVFAVLTYLGCAANLPLVDKYLLMIDRSLGFDWPGWYQVIVDRPVLSTVVVWIYNSMIYQGLYFSLLFGMMHRPDRLRELFWTMFVAGIITTMASVLLPALGTFDAFGHPEQADYLVDMGILRGGGALNFELGKLTGIVSFPSFHTTMALVYAFCFRGSGPAGYFIVLLDFLMLPTIPFVGGHYLADMLGGAAVAAVALPAGIWVSKLDWVSNREKITAGLPRPSAG